MRNVWRLLFAHLTIFISLIIPLLGATIIWASNGRFYVKFIDALYISVSGATGTGLVTADLSALTIWQEVVLVILELIGNQVGRATTSYPLTLLMQM